MNMKYLGNVTLEIPAVVFDMAGIKPSDPLTGFAGCGIIVLVKADLLDLVPDELKTLFDDLGIPPETVRSVLAEDNGIAEALAAKGT